MVTNGSALDRTRDQLHRESRLFRRLEKHKKDGAARLATAVVATVHDAEAISAHVVRFFPQYTLHSETHLWNVLGWMEELAEPAIEQLGPLDCALAIQAAFIHDLGMVPSDDEYRDLGNPETDAGRAFQAYCDGHPLYAELERLRKLGKQKTPILGSTQEDLLRGQLFADYLRTTHADERVAQGQNRILGWLNKFDVEDNYRGLPYRPCLALIAMSHGQPIDWLPARLKRGPGGLDGKVNVNAHDFAGEKVHWCQIAWLLRLADIMDFDATRTPKVVFEHLGIQNPTSRDEWQKHLSVAIGPRTFKDASPLQYPVGCCPAPRIEKSLLQYCHWIDEELRGVRDQRVSLREEDRLPLKLPSRAEPGIVARAGGYKYEDLEIRLDRDAIIELLMGEALYGEPELALRELVQNALDALHLRDLRHRLLVELEDSPELSQVGPVARIRKNETLAVEVKWGEDNGRSFIKVRDNGVGMTRDSITRYLTQIGKSYYKSSDFNREKALMRRALKGQDAELALMSPISQFGIGFLSCFMLADHITVHTRSAGESWRVEIDGPHGFIALYPDDTAPKPSGTEVTLWLRDGLKLAPFDQEDLIRILRKELFHIETTRADGSPEILPKQEGIEPAFAIARYVLWPLYPVRLQPGGVGPEVTLDPDMILLRERILPLDCEAIRASAIGWAVDPMLLGNPVWDPLTWRHADPSGGTGSGVRFLVPRSIGVSRTPEEWLRFQGSDSRGVPQWVLNALTAAHLSTSGRSWVLINGIRVAELSLDTLLSCGGGTICFWDLRGEAAPRLRADRKVAVRHTDSRQVAAFEKLQKEVIAHLAPKSLDEARWRCHAIAGDLPRPETSLSTARLLSPDLTGASAWEWLLRLSEACLQEATWYRALAREGEGAIVPARDGALDLACAPERDLIDRLLASRIARGLDRVLDRALDLACVLFGDLARARARARALDRFFDFDLPRDRALTLARARAGARDLALSRAAVRTWPNYVAIGVPPLDRWAELLRSHLFSEALWPDLGRCFAPLSTGFAGPVGGKWIEGPLTLAQPRPGQPQPLPGWLHDYDLVAPLTAVPLNLLRERFPAWQSERAWRAMLMLPFLFGEVPVSWKEKTEVLLQTMSVDSIMLLMPDPERITLLFLDGTEADWAASSASAIWCIREGTVLWAEGIHTRVSLKAQGKPLDAFFPQKQPR
jgi:hypothetical protein